MNFSVPNGVLISMPDNIAWVATTNFQFREKQASKDRQHCHHLVLTVFFIYGCDQKQTNIQLSKIDNMLKFLYQKIITFFDLRS